LRLVHRGIPGVVTKVLVVATAEVAPEEISSPIEDRFGEDAEFAVIPISGGSNRAGTIAEARRRYGADEVVVVTRVSDEASWVETGAVESARDRLDFPLTHLLVA
jgi:hypothetical protein